MFNRISEPELWVLAIALSALSLIAGAQTAVTQTIAYAPVIQYTDGSVIPATVPVTYDLEHHLCGQTAWTVIAAGLTAPTSTRQVDAQCHVYSMVAIAGGQRSVESDVTQIDLSPPKVPKAPSKL